MKHIIPNVLGLVAVYASLEVPGLILFESFLSFLGLGTQEPMSSWGALLSDGAAQNGSVALVINFPGIFPFALPYFVLTLSVTGCVMHSIRKIDRSES